MNEQTRIMNKMNFVWQAVYPEYSGSVENFIAAVFEDVDYEDNPNNEDELEIVNAPVEAALDTHIAEYIEFVGEEGFQAFCKQEGFKPGDLKL
jgi:hypothetical protein